VHIARIPPTTHEQLPNAGTPHAIECVARLFTYSIEHAIPLNQKLGSKEGSLSYAPVFMQ
jgi:hypothetical protein